jgi:glycosyltransferase involved in cell wall biosynthesis
MSLPKISIIIPCYNQGIYIEDALKSIQHLDQSLIETIIVNDGSTDKSTNEICRQLQEQGLRVIFQKNQGLSGARNAGIAVAKGQYILPLDADNKIRHQLITKSIDILDNQEDIAVVYSDAQYFGDQSGVRIVGPFNMQRLMLANYIDACAVIRKSTLEKIGFYDTEMKIGWEDWDLWLRMAFAGYNFYYLNETLFDYRVVKNSMSKTLYDNYQKPNSIENYIHEKYPDRMGHVYITNHLAKRFKKNPLLFIVKLVLRAYFPNYYNKLLSKNKIRNGL